MVTHRWRAIRPQRIADNETIESLIADTKARGLVEARTGDSPCDPSDLSACAAACEAGSGWACTNAGDAASEQQLEDDATQFYRLECTHRDADGCAEHAKRVIDGKDYSPEEPYALLAVACELGAIRACEPAFVYMSKYAEANGPWAPDFFESAHPGEGRVAMQGQQDPLAGLAKVQVQLVVVEDPAAPGRERGGEGRALQLQGVAVPAGRGLA